MTNLITNPENFSLWTKGLGAAVDADATTSPDGTSTADRLIDDNAGGSTSSLYVLEIVNGLSLNKLHTFSVFGKADGVNWAYFLATAYGAIEPSVYADLVGAEIGDVSVDVVDSGLIQYSNGWVRIWQSFISDAVDPNGNVRIYAANENNDRTMDRDGSSSIFVWGADLREGALSDYISQAGITIPIGSPKTFIAVDRRTAKQMNVKQRIGKARKTLRGEFE